MMLWLAENWVVGVSVISVICVTLYLTYSILLVRSCRKVNYDVGVSAMIPIWNIIVLIKRGLKVRKLTKVIKEDELIEI